MPLRTRAEQMLRDAAPARRMRTTLALERLERAAGRGADARRGLRRGAALDGARAALSGVDDRRRRRQRRDARARARAGRPSRGSRRSVPARRRDDGPAGGDLRRRRRARVPDGHTRPRRRPGRDGGRAACPAGASSPTCPPAIAARLPGDTSARTTVDGGSSSRLAIGRLHSRSPPLARSSATSASMIACDPPSTIGQPTVWASPPEEHPDAGRERPVERHDRVGGQPGEQPGRGVSRKRFEAMCSCRPHRVQAEPRHPDRVPRDAERRHHAVDELQPVPFERAEERVHGARRRRGRRPCRQPSARASPCDRRADERPARRGGSSAIRAAPRGASGTPRIRARAAGSPSTRRG